MWKVDNIVKTARIHITTDIINQIVSPIRPENVIIQIGNKITKDMIVAIQQNLFKDTAAFVERKRLNTPVSAKTTPVMTKANAKNLKSRNSCAAVKRKPNNILSEIMSTAK